MEEVIQHAHGAGDRADPHALVARSAQTAMSSAPIVVQRDTRAWQIQVWVSFGIAVFLCAVYQLALAA